MNKHLSRLALLVLLLAGCGRGESVGAGYRTVREIDQLVLAELQTCYGIAREHHAGHGTYARFIEPLDKRIWGEVEVEYPAGGLKRIDVRYICVSPQRFVMLAVPVFGEVEWFDSVSASPHAEFRAPAPYRTFFVDESGGIRSSPAEIDQLMEAAFNNTIEGLMQEVASAQEAFKDATGRYAATLTELNAPPGANTKFIDNELADGLHDPCFVLVLEGRDREYKAAFFVQSTEHRYKEIYIAVNETGFHYLQDLAEYHELS